MEMAGRLFLKWRVANLLVGFPDIEFCFGTRVRSLPDARIATPKKRLPGAGGGFLTRAAAPPGRVLPSALSSTQLTEHGGLSGEVDVFLSTSVRGPIGR